MRNDVDLRVYQRVYTDAAGRDQPGHRVGLAGASFARFRSIDRIGRSVSGPRDCHGMLNPARMRVQCADSLFTLRSVKCPRKSSQSEQSFTSA